MLSDAHLPAEITPWSSLPHHTVLQLLRLYEAPLPRSGTFVDLAARGGRRYATACPPDTWNDAVNDAGMNLVDDDTEYVYIVLNADGFILAHD